MSKEDFTIINSEGDFFQAQNYVIQLCAERKLTSTEFLLYSFYKSLGGFREIRMSYDYTVLNTGISKGSVSSGNKTLVKLGLIKLKSRGVNRPFLIEIVPGSALPRRNLKSLQREESDNTVEKKFEDLRNEYKKEISKNEDIELEPTEQMIHNPMTEKTKEFIEEFTKVWCKHSKAKRYTKNDYKKLFLIKDDIEEAKKYIPILWTLDSVDPWVRDSDHSITVFVSQFISGKLQSMYPKTKQYHIDRQKLEGLS